MDKRQSDNIDAMSTQPKGETNTKHVSNHEIRTKSLAADHVEIQQPTIGLPYQRYSLLQMHDITQESAVGLGIS